jgi:predicted DNA-binding transcriptional regulator AlpA
MSSDEIRPTLIRVRAVQNFFGGVSRMWLHRRLADDAAFPKPVWIGGERFFRLTELEQYTKEAADRAPPPRSQNLKDGGRP